MGSIVVLVALTQQRGEAQRLQVAGEQARLETAASESPEDIVLSAPAKPDTGHWPRRKEADEVVHQAGEIAQTHSVSLRALSVSHQIASAQTWGQVTLDASASGPYPALKAWQAAMQQRFPVLSVRLMRLQGQPLNASGLDAQVIWVLHVRDSMDASPSNAGPPLVGCTGTGVVGPCGLVHGRGRSSGGVRNAAHHFGGQRNVINRRCPDSSFPEPLGPEYHISLKA